MSCTRDRFIINKGMTNEFIIRIKQNNSTLAMKIEPTDTFTYHLFHLETEVEVLSDVATIHDAPNGQIKIEFTDTFVDTLDSEIGPKEDRYYLKPVYRLAIECHTVNNGIFIAKIPFVYVRK